VQLGASLIPVGGKGFDANRMKAINDIGENVWTFAVYSSGSHVERFGLSGAVWAREQRLNAAGRVEAASDGERDPCDTQRSTTERSLAGGPRATPPALLCNPAATFLGL
jgi:hypothetical protein